MQEVEIRNDDFGNAFINEDYYVVLLEQIGGPQEPLSIDITLQDGQFSPRDVNLTQLKQCPFLLFKVILENEWGYLDYEKRKESLAGAYFFLSEVQERLHRFILKYSLLTIFKRHYSR